MSILSKDSDGKTALHYCSEHLSSTTIAALLLSRDRAIIDVKDGRGMTALAHAVMLNNALMTRWLLSQGADGRCRDEEGHSLFHLAAGQYRFSM